MKLVNHISAVWALTEEKIIYGMASDTNSLFILYQSIIDCVDDKNKFIICVEHGC
jgi:hypothetical protein